jgi:hypothetical protein
VREIIYASKNTRGAKKTTYIYIYKKKEKNRRNKERSHIFVRYDVKTVNLFISKTKHHTLNNLRYSLLKVRKARVFHFLSFFLSGTRFCASSVLVSPFFSGI